MKRAADEHTAAVMLELVQGEGGVRQADPAFVAALSRLCRERGILLLVDEVQTGMGRTGSLFAFEQYGVVPDVVTLAKGLGNGIPVGAMMARRSSFRCSDPAAMPAPSAGIRWRWPPPGPYSEEIRRPELLKNVREQGERLLVSLREGLGNLPSGKGVRGLGLMVGIELTIDANAGDPARPGAGIAGAAGRTPGRPPPAPADRDGRDGRPGREHFGRCGIGSGGDGGMRAYLVLDTGEVFPGRWLGRPVETKGKLVFTTGMTGYQEALTDPSYAGQVVTFTYPLVGNCGVNPEECEGARPLCAGVVMSEVYDGPGGSLAEWLAEQGVPRDRGGRYPGCGEAGPGQEAGAGGDLLLSPSVPSGIGPIRDPWSG